VVCYVTQNPTRNRPFSPKTPICAPKTTKSASKSAPEIDPQNDLKSDHKYVGKTPKSTKSNFRSPKPDLVDEEQSLLA